MAGGGERSQLAMTGEEIEALTGSVAVADRTGRPGVAGSDAARLSGEAIVLCRGDEDLACIISTVMQRCVERAMAYGALAALDDRPRTGQRADDHAGGQGLVGIFGLRQGQGARLSA